MVIITEQGGVAMRKITSSIYEFETLIERGYLYVDKTEYLWKLVQNYGESYFLARPRRFGKSLTVSTLKAIFEGKKHLFEGLAISKTDYDWQQYPVIHLDMANCNATTANDLNACLSMLLLQLAKNHGIDLFIDERILPSCFENLVNTVAGDGKVVILVDEYDKPILGNLGTPEADAILDILKGFYSTIKKCNGKERFVFITGVSKFSHVSMFSGFNNPTDISMHRDFATMFGYTQSEFETKFAEHIDHASQQTCMAHQDLLTEIKQWYDGYRFEETAETVYNPVSLAKFFENNYKFNNYWFSTGTPTFLMKLAREKNFNIEKTISEPVVGLAFNAFEIDKVDPLTLLLQTGYLTIKSSYTEDLETLYYLDFPNREVKTAFETYLINDYTGLSESEIGVTVFKLRKALKTEDFGLFMDLLKTFYAGIGYNVGAKVEGRYQIIFVSIFTLLGFKVDAESHTNAGRIDTYLETGDRVYIFEFKINQTAQIALNQIREKEYFQRFKHLGKQIILVGISFNTKKRQLTDWLIEKI